MNCKQCGAPLEAGAELCPYCGMPTPYDEALVGEKQKEKQRLRQEAERQKKLAGLSQMKYVSGAFIPILYLFTLFLWSPYWYATRMKSLNELSSPVKLPAWIVGVFALSFVSVFCTESIQEVMGYAGWNIEDMYDISNAALGVAAVASAWLAFRVRDILQAHASQYLEKAVAVRTIAPSGMLLLLFGPAYLQSQVNKMIAMELLTPKI